MRRYKDSLGKAAVAIAALILTTSSAMAQSPDSTATSGPDQWHYIIGLYVWAPAITGSLSVRNFPEVPIDVPFDDLWHHLKFNITGHFEAAKGPFGFGLDAFYVHLGAAVSGQIPDLLNTSVNLREFIGEGFGYYRLAQGSGDNPWKLQFLGGVRFWDINTRLESDLPDAGGKTMDWADGFGGLRLEVPLGSKLILLGRGDVGAGGSKLDWSASGDLAYRLGKGWLVDVGYRTLNVDYDKAGIEGRERSLFDVSMSGPRLFIAYSW